MTAMPAGSLLMATEPRKAYGTARRGTWNASYEFSFRAAVVTGPGDGCPVRLHRGPRGLGAGAVLTAIGVGLGVALLMPVAVFIATAVRFGGERRDRWLAALRLVGSDGSMTRRIAAGEAVAGAVLGLVLGTVFFLIGRKIAGSVEVFDVSVFPSDLTPSPVLAPLVTALSLPPLVRLMRPDGLRTE